MNYTLHNGNSAEILKQYPDNHFDSVVTDPPYLIGFLGKEWDKADNKLDDVYRECFRVLKPGGHLLAFSAARTYHHLAMTIEQVGFEIRDQIMWIYSSGFPKSQDVGKNLQRQLGVKETTKNPNARGLKKDRSLYESGHQKETPGENVVCPDPLAKEWEGWGTALKPAHEPIVMARKPMKHSVVKNVQTYNTGAINVDATRIKIEGEDTRNGGSNGWNRTEFGQAEPNKYDGQSYTPNEIGRFPSNIIGEIPDYQKYFYCPKVSRSERHMGFDEIPYNKNSEVGGMYGPNQAITRKNNEDKGNNHPTVKPVDLMAYLIKLVTKKGGLVLDPFNGSGSTGLACVREGMNYVGIDLDEKYIEISRKRIEAYKEIIEGKSTNTFDDLFDLE